jgi:hypothetical protein
MTNATACAQFPSNVAIHNVQFDRLVHSVSPVVLPVVAE